MATKRFCDACDREMLDNGYVAAEVYVQNKGERVGYYIERAGNTPAYDICRYCQLDAMKTRDDRAMEMPEYGVPRDPTPTIVARGVAAYDEAKKSNTPIDIVIGHIWRRMFDEAVRTLPPAYGKGGATKDLDDRLRVQLDRPGWQTVPIKLTEQQLDRAGYEAAKKTGTIQSRTVTEAMWAELLAAVRA